MKFDSIPGNTELKDTLKSLIQSQAFPHCILLTGEQGSGVFPIGLAIATALFCTDEEEFICGNCNACKLMNNLQQPDIHFTFPIIKVKRKETSNAYREKWNTFVKESPFITYFNWLKYLESSSKQGIIPVSEIGDINHFAQMYSYGDGPKILFVWCAEYLGKNGNRLLKLIEEPPEDMYIILIAESREQILNTILSRAQHYHFPNPSKEEIETYLINKFPQMAKADIEQASVLAGGNIAKAMEFLQKSTTEQVNMLLPWLRDCYTAKSDALYKWASAYNGFSREEKKIFWDYFLQYLQELQRIIVGSKTLPRLPEKQIVAAQKMSKLLNYQALGKIYETIQDAIIALERNDKSDLTFMSASYRIHRIFRLN